MAKKPKPNTKPKSPQKLIEDHRKVKTISMDPQTFAIRGTLKKQRKGVMPLATPIDVPVDQVILVEVVRTMGDKKPLKFAIPLHRLSKAIPNIGRCDSIKVIK